MEVTICPLDQKNHVSTVKNQRITLRGTAKIAPSTEYRRTNDMT